MGALSSLCTEGVVTECRCAANGADNLSAIAEKSPSLLRNGLRKLRRSIRLA